MSEQSIYLEEDQEVKAVLDYTSRDFAAIRTQLIGLAKGFMPEWETAGEASDFGTLLLELFAYMGDVQNFYIDRAASEAFLGTALRRSSVMYIADMLGYKPVGQHSSTVRLRFSVPSDDTVEDDFTITLPAGTRIHNEADNADDVIVFELAAPLDLKKGDTDIEAIAIEGRMIYDRRVAVSSGAPLFEVVLAEKGVVSNTVSIVTREGGDVIKWTEVSDISLGRPTQSVFATYLDDLDYTHVIFGDNTSGRIPPTNAQIYATYRIGVGVEANSLEPGSLQIIQASADLADKIWAVSVTNTEPPVGGTDPESVDSMRYSIPRAAGRIKNRAITLNDYADLALQVPGVVKSTSYGTVYTSVHVVIAPVDGQGYTESMQELIADTERYLSDKVLIGSSVIVEPEDITALWKDVYIRVTVHVQPSYNRTSVRLAVDQSLRNVLAFSAVDFGTRVSLGLVYRTIMAVPGVEWAELNWLSDTAPTFTEETTLDPDSLTRTVAEIDTESTKIPKVYEYPIPDPNPDTDGRLYEGGKVTEPLDGPGDFDSAHPLHEWLQNDSERTHDGIWVKATGGLPNT